ncbi:putative sporulation protein YtxC [Clostridium cellulovorans]|uniref:Sporulation protein YtxC n=1 Tax=Clostridium cellulovorans (strain ATCC 35296 / DSM 3052 / OCM 3 / 743B) TaxID=573061 RepID=D9SM16_CLOC7|nr:putative sporulation protein YtxC [Clostridium cellulovorans]ADL51747.1 sporulation protein YtxC [Clostridium cellulovorans 743B]
MILKTIIYDVKKFDISKEITNIKNSLKEDSIVIGISESKISNNHMIKIFSNDECVDDRVVRIINSYLSEILYKKIVNIYCENGLEDYINESYFFLTFDEINEVKHRSVEAMDCRSKVVDEDSIFFLNIKNTILGKIFQCVIETPELNIDGFTTFRCKELSKKFTPIVDKVIGAFLVEKEYNEFIKLLKYFVEIQESKIDVLNIIIKDNGEYLLLDKEGNSLMQEIFKDIYSNDISGIVNMEDIIISSLITNAPGKIILHNSSNCKNKEFIDTIKKVFDNRVEVCMGCDFCIEKLPSKPENIPIELL